MAFTISSTAINATLHCLTGCAIGEIAGMVISSGFGFSNIATIIISISLAFAFGYSLSMQPLLKGGMSLKSALGIALAADSLSILTMEVVDNGFTALIPGALNAHLYDLLFWITLSLSLLLAYIAAVPVNAYLISKGKGHCVAMEHHHHEGH